MAILEELKAKAGGKADKANNIQEAVSMMEFGGGSSGCGVFVVKTVQDENTMTLDKTWQEIHDAMLSKICVVVVTDNNTVHQVLITAVGVGPDYFVMLGESTCRTSTANGYPVVSVSHE